MSEDKLIENTDSSVPSSEGVHIADIGTFLGTEYWKISGKEMPSAKYQRPNMLFAEKKREGKGRKGERMRDSCQLTNFFP